VPQRTSGLVDAGCCLIIWTTARQTHSGDSRALR